MPQALHCVPLKEAPRMFWQTQAQLLDHGLKMVPLTVPWPLHHDEGQGTARGAEVIATNVARGVRVNGVKGTKGTKGAGPIGVVPHLALKWRPLALASLLQAASAASAQPKSTTAATRVESQLVRIVAGSFCCCCC
jgi:hypothetical protein